MYREIENYLQQWKQSYNRKPLIIRGARQVGKSFIVDQFGKENYDHYLKLDMEQDPELIRIFQNYNTEQIINELSTLFQVPFVPGKTLLFIDEIQLAPKAIACLRYFYEQMPDIHVIAAGSLLDHTLNDIQYSMPVGRVEFAYLYPLSFKEFLMAVNQKGLLAYIENFGFETPFSELIHHKILEWLWLYFFIGGMPEAVKTYIETQNLIEVEKVHTSIITSLQYDFAKYGTRKQQEHLKEVLSYCANTIGRKVKYANINRDANARLLKDALLKLELSRIVHLVRNTKSAQVPITQYEDNDVFKPIFMDIGLVCNLAKIKLTDIRNLATDFEGGLAEQFVGQELICSGKFFQDTKLHYWNREAKNSNAEIDYLHQVQNEIYPVEVKSGKRGTLRSLHVFLAEKNKRTGIRLNLDVPNYGKELNASVNTADSPTLNYDLISLPLYFAGWLDRLV